MLKRLQMMVALGAATLPLPLSAASVPVTLTPGTAFTRIGSRDIAMLGFNGTCPGPEIRLRQNEILRARVENGLEDGTLVHWHGIRLPNAMDGVNVLTQDVIIPNEGYEYRFPVSGFRFPMPEPTGITPTTFPTNRSPAGCSAP